MKNLNLVLTKISEECGEVTQICSKIIFYGIDNISPKADNTNKASNRDKLIEELGDVLSNMKVLIEHTEAGITWDDVYTRRDTKFNKLMDYILPEDFNVKD